MKTKKIALFGLLVALAMILSYVESQIPAFFAVPGMKLGLTNVVVLFALYRLDYKSAIVINVLRILIVGFMFGNGVSIIYSLAGGLLSGMLMIVLKRFTKLSMISISVVGGLSHNLGQILVAMIMLQTKQIAWYLIFLWFSGIAAGVVIGVIGAELVKRIKTA